MKFFDVRAELAKIQNQQDTPATSATPATQTPQNAPHVAKVADVAAPPAEIPNFEKPTVASEESDMRHGFAVNGYPKTWTGKVVSLEAWRELSEWDRYGPDGRVWCGMTQKWRRK